MGQSNPIDLYDDTILNHCRNPRNSELIITSDLAGTAVNAFCGDEVDIQLRLHHKQITAIGIQARGCSINQASASMLSEVVTGKKISETLYISKLFRDMMRGGDLSSTNIDLIGDLTSLQTVLEFPVRVKCALLSWTALEDAVECTDQLDLVTGPNP